MFPLGIKPQISGRAARSLCTARHLRSAVGGSAFPAGTVHLLPLRRVVCEKCTGQCCPLVAQRVAFLRSLPWCSQAVSQSETWSKSGGVMQRLLWRPCRGAAVHVHFFTSCDIVFLFVSFRCLIELELEYSGLKDVRTFNSELTNSITIGIVVLAATSS